MTTPGVAADTAVDLADAAFTLARRFFGGATMWCVAPQWPAHGRHVAVEFVHPVIVGKRALPAISIDNADVVGTVRLLARPGDVILAISSADHGDTIDLLARAEAWGLTRLWLGAGPRPPIGRAEHVIWHDTIPVEEAVRSGEIVLSYHLLWELSHVVFEHPGLLAPEECLDDVCITCSDEGRVAEISSVIDAAMAEAVVEGHVEEIDVSLVGPVVPGDLVLAHAGVALVSLTDRSS